MKNVESKYIPPPQNIPQPEGCLKAAVRAYCISMAGRQIAEVGKNGSHFTIVQCNHCAGNLIAKIDFDLENGVAGKTFDILLEGGCRNEYHRPGGVKYNIQEI